MAATERITMTMRELDRFKVIQDVADGKLEPWRAAERLGLTTRQVRRQVARLREHGPAGLVSGHRAKPGNRRLAPGTADRALSIIRDRYADFGPTLACEKLWECHGIRLAKETVRKPMTEAGLWIPRRQRPPKVYQPRARRAYLGELIQIDGCDHRWFEQRAPACALPILRFTHLFFASPQRVPILRPTMVGLLPISDLAAFRGVSVCQPGICPECSTRSPGMGSRCAFMLIRAADRPRSRCSATAESSIDVPVWPAHANPFEQHGAPMRITPGPPPLPDRSNDAAPQTGTSTTTIGESPRRGDNAQSPEHPPRLPRHPLRRAATLPSIRHLPGAGGALSTDLRHNYARKRVYDDAVAIDQLGMNSYAARRRKTLDALPGAEAISAQYGISLASYREDRNTLAELRFDSLYTGKYQREFQSERFHADCRALYEAQGGNPNDNVVFVHSDDAAWQMMSRVETTTGRVESAQMPIIKIAPGLTAIRCGSADEADILDKWITIMGARPSAYRIASLTCPRVRDEVMDPGISNRRLLAPLRDDTPGHCVAALRAIPEHHSAHALAQTSAALITDMAEVLERSGKAEALDHSPILASGLQSLVAIAEAMPPLAQRSDRFANAYQAMIEELQVVLMAAHPYGEADFKRAAHDQFAARMGTVAGQHGIAAPEIYLTSSGMGALASAFELAEELSGRNKVQLASSAPRRMAPDYYEIIQLLRSDNIIEDSDVVSATLNPSSTEKRAPDDQERAWNVHVLIGKLAGLLQRQATRAKTPLTVVLDTTIERRGDMQALLDRFSRDIAAGRVRFVICKSYQKFANLTTAKVMAGSITLLAADDETSAGARQRLRLSEQAIGWAGNDEIQLLTHFLRNGDPHEFTLLERAASNADFVRTACFFASADRLGFDTYDEGLPLARMQYSQTADQTFRFASDWKTTFTRPVHLMESITTRDSFAFPSTTKINIESSIRLSFGLESRAELMEMFYTPGLLMRTPRSIWGTREAHKHVMALVDSAMKDIDPDDAARTQPLQDKITRIGVAEAESQDMEASLFATTQRMRANLHRDNDRSRFTVNRIASVVEHMARVSSFNENAFVRFYAGGRDREIADELLDGLINAGMPGVSERTRARIVDFRATLAALDWTSDDPSIRLRGVQSLLHGVRRLADADKRAKYLAVFPDAIFREVPDATRTQLIDQMFRPLDAVSRQAFLDKRPRGDIANACKAEMDFDIQSARD